MTKDRTEKSAVMMSGKEVTEEVTKEVADVSEQEEKTRKLEAKIAKESLMFNIGSLSLMAVVGPLLYYSIKINDYGHTHKPEGLFFPGIKDYWRVLLGIVVTIPLHDFFIYALTPFFKTITEKTDELVIHKTA